MSINTYQQPFLVTLNNRIHGDVYPVYYTALSNQYTQQGFNYKFEINTKDGILSTFKIPPQPTGGLGVFNPIPVIKDELYSNFQPDLVDFDTVSGQLLQYRIDVEESGIGSPAVTNFFKVWLHRNSNENFQWENFELDGTTKKFLTEWDSTRVVTTSDRGTLRCFDGTLVNTNYPGNTSYIYQIGITIDDGSKYLKHYRSDVVNPNYNDTTVIGLSPSNSVLVSLDKYILDVPAYPWNLNQMDWWYYARTTKSTGISVSLLPTLITDPVLYDGYSYSFYSLGDEGSVVYKKSKDYNFTIENDCDNESIQLSWENIDGGYDYLTLKMNKTKKIFGNKSSFTKFRDTLGNNPTYQGNYNYIGHNDIDRGETVYYNEIMTEWSVYTDYLSKDDIEDMGFLFKSKEVFARIGDTWYPVIITNDGETINRDQRGFRQYLINFRLSNREKI